jgi:hypothetical protein
MLGVPEAYREETVRDPEAGAYQGDSARGGQMGTLLLNAGRPFVSLGEAMFGA